MSVLSFVFSMSAHKTHEPLTNKAQTEGNISMCKYMCMTKKRIVLSGVCDEIVFHITIAKGVVKLFFCFRYYFFLYFFGANMHIISLSAIHRLAITSNSFFHASCCFISQAINQSADIITICFYLLSHYVHINECVCVCGFSFACAIHINDFRFVHSNSLQFSSFSIAQLGVYIFRV